MRHEQHRFGRQGISALNISGFIWGIADDVLRDVYVRGKYRDVILPMTVIRRLDAVLEPTKDAVLKMKEQLDGAGVTNQDAALRQASGEAFYNTSQFRLRDLTSRGRQQQLRADFEAYLDGFSPNLIADKIQEDPYRFLVCADKFQTGYDEPLLHTMYVDKPLSGVKAVQTLSRLNRAHPKKHDAFVLDFANDVDTIQYAFADYYKTTILADETDPDRLHDLKAALDGYQVYSQTEVDELVARYLSGAERDKLDPILDACVATYREQLDEDGQVEFKGSAKAFLRAYGFLSVILPYTQAEWEKLSIFLNFLVPKLPAPAEDDLSKGILEAIDMDSYRVEKQAVRDIQLADEDAEIGPVPTEGGGQKPEPEMDRLSNIINDFNERFGNIEWKDADKITKVIAEELPTKVAGDKAYQNAMANSDKQNARIEHDKALERAMTELVADHTELFKQFSDNESFRRWLLEMNFAATYLAPAAPGSGSGSGAGQ